MYFIEQEKPKTTVAPTGKLEFIKYNLCIHLQVINEATNCISKNFPA